MKTLTSSQYKEIKRNLDAFITNFGNIRIERASCGSGFYVYWPANSEDYLQFCHNIYYLDGWLYGAVQGVNRISPIMDKGAETCNI